MPYVGKRASVLRSQELVETSPAPPSQRPLFPKVLASEEDSNLLASENISFWLPQPANKSQNVSDVIVSS